MLSSQSSSFSFSQSKAQPPQQQAQPPPPQQQRQAPVNQPASAAVNQRPKAQPVIRRRPVTFERESSSSYFCEGALHHQLSTMSMRAPKAGDMFHNEMKMEKVRAMLGTENMQQRMRSCNVRFACRDTRRKRKWEHLSKSCTGSRQSWANKPRPRYVHKYLHVHEIRPVFTLTYFITLPQNGTDWKSIQLYLRDGVVLCK